MKKIVIAIYLLCMISSLSYAQNFRYGFTGGVNLSKPTGNIEPDGLRAGLLLGIKGELGIPAIANGVYTEFGLQLSTKGNKSGLVIGLENENLQTTTDINYLVVPIHVGYKIECGKSLSLFANTGPYAGVGLWGKKKYFENGKKSDSSSKVFAEKAYERFDCGWGVNIGMEYAKHFQLTLGGNWGLKDISKVDGWKYKNRNFTISLGYIL